MFHFHWKRLSRLLSLMVFLVPKVELQVKTNFPEGDNYEIDIQASNLDFYWHAKI